MDALADLFPNLYLGFSIALSLKNLMYCFIGVFVGTVIGVLPGIGPLAAIAMLLPLTFKLDAVAALIMLSGIYYGTKYGGSTTAIMLKLPGESASVVTCLDGYEMAKQGRAGPALGMAAVASFIAGSIGTVLDRHVRAAAGGSRAAFRRSRVLLADAVQPDRRGGARARLHVEGARHDRRWDCCSASSAPTSIPACRASRSASRASPTASTSSSSRWAFSALPRSCPISNRAA